MANKIVSLVLLQIHSHTLPSLHVLSSSFSRKNPKAMADKGKQPVEENNFPPKKRTIQRVIFSSYPFSCPRLQSHDSLPFVFSLDLLPKEILGTEEVPEYIPSYSSTEEEDATPEQRTNHQLRRRIRHLEHDLWDITARCSAERECRMNLEALVGGKILILW
jgi:hypothetical protein